MFCPGSSVGLERSASTRNVAGSNPARGTDFVKCLTPIAQLVEQETFNFKVPGSSPGGGTSSSLSMPLLDLYRKNDY